MTDFNQWIETLSYWRQKRHQPTGQPAPAELLSEIEREERENAEPETLLRSLPSDEYVRLYEQGRRREPALSPGIPAP